MGILIHEMETKHVVSEFDRGSVVSLFFARRYDPDLSDYKYNFMVIVTPKDKFSPDVKEGDFLVPDQDNPGCYRVDEIATARARIISGGYGGATGYLSIL